MQTPKRVNRGNLHRGNLLYKLARLDESERALREAIRLAPNWTSPRNNRAYALYFSGRCADAILRPKTSSSG